MIVIANIYNYITNRKKPMPINTRFRLSNRSITRLKGVDENLIAVVERAIQITEIDFGISQGLRTIEQQTELVAKGKSQTMKSKHLVGDAVDVVAYVDGKVSWRLEDYTIIADAFKQAAKDLDVHMRWGAAWTCTDLRMSARPMAKEMEAYSTLRKSQGRTPFLDGPHFELMS